MGRRGAGLRTETTINNTCDFGVGRLLGNLPKLREIGFAANRRMLEVEKTATTAESAQRHSKPCKARLALRPSAPALCALVTRACRPSLQCSCCSASNSKASATGNCGHYLRRCSAWKKTTSVRAT